MSVGIDGELDRMVAERPDLIVTDLLLPDMNSIEATAALKRNPYTYKIPVVVLTAMADRHWKAEALKASVSKYLVEPISLFELGAIVKTLA